MISRASSFRSLQSGSSVRRLLDSPRDQFDWALFLVAAALAVVGVVNLYSATSVVRASLSDLYVQQVYWLVAGGILGALAAAIDYRYIERYGYAIYGFGVVLLLLVFVLGRDIRGSSRWIQIGSFSLQPSEFMKIFLIIALAKYLHNDPKTEPRKLADLAIPTLFAALPVALVLRQPDLGTALILLLVFATIAAMMRIQWRSLAWLTAVLGVSGPLVWSYLLKPYQKQRVLSFLRPEENLLGANWHAHHARVAIGSGRLLGEGFMRGTQNQFLFLPDQYTDFPFPVFAEDWGFVGTIVLVGLYAFLVLWGIRVAQSSRDRFGAVLAMGTAALVFWHVFFNLGMVTGMLPVVGVTLPLFSYGGSSVMTVMIALGLLMNVSIRRHQVTPR